MTRCICLHRDQDHAQLPTGEFAGNCKLCRCVDFKALVPATDRSRVGEAAIDAYRKSAPADREGLEELLGKRLRRRFETLFDEEALGHVASALIQAAWSLGWDECRESYDEEPDADVVDVVAEAVRELREIAVLLRLPSEKFTETEKCESAARQLGRVIDVLALEAPADFTPPKKKED